MTKTSVSRRLERLEASYHVAIRQAGEHARNLESVIRKRVLGACPRNPQDRGNRYNEIG